MIEELPANIGLMKQRVRSDVRLSVEEGIWLISFMHYDLGYFDLEQKTLQPLDNPFGTRLSPMSQVQFGVHPMCETRNW